MTGMAMAPFRQNLRLLLRAGVPAAAVLVALVGIVLWRIAVLERASAAEDRADQSVVMAASLAGDFVRMQNDARAALLMRDVRHSRQRELAARVEVRFARLPSLLTEERYRAQVRDIRATYLRWQARTAPAALLRSHKESAPFTAADLRLTLSESLLTKADELVQALRGSRMEASHANEDAARSAVFMSIGGTIVLLLVLAGSIFWSLAETQREAQQRWQLERQNEQIRELARVKSEFVTHMSHELRTPLTGIMGMAEVLRDDKAGPVTPRQKHYLTDILASSNHLLDLINRVLDLAKAEAGKISIQPRRCDPAALAVEVAKTVRSIAAAKRITLSVHTEAAPASAITDPSRFRQILYNYVSNALKFTPEGGRVAIRVAFKTPDRLRVEVSDTGIGIAPRDLEKLFRDFSQLDGPAVTQRGAGLGLALSKRLVEMQGGTVGVTSEPGKGSTFFAILPCLGCESPATSAAPERAPVQPTYSLRHEP